MGRHEKAAALMMTAVIMFSSLTLGACKKSFEADDNTWYSTRKFEVGEEYRTDETIDYYYTGFVGAYKDKLYYFTTGTHHVPEDQDMATVMYEELQFEILDIYDLEGNKTDSIDLHKVIDDMQLFTDGYFGFNITDQDGLCIQGDDLVVHLSMNPMGRGDRVQATGIDVKLSLKDLSFVSKTDADATQISTDDLLICSQCTGIDVYDGYMVETFWTMYPGTRAVMRVMDPKGNSVKYDLMDACSAVKTAAIVDTIYLGDYVMLLGILEEDEYTKDYFTFNIKNGEVQPYEEDTSWVRNYLRECKESYVDGIGYVTTDSKGINKIDFEKKEVSQLLSFDACNINRSIANQMEIVSLENDRIILTGSFSRGYFTEIETDVYVLDRQDTNPKLTKTIITAATLTEFDYPFCEAVCNFNETNPDYYISLEGKYSLKEKYLAGEIDYYDGGLSDDELNAQQELSNQLAIDLMAGDGPDMILDGASFYQLYNGEYLTDLSPYIDSEGLFENVIEAAKTDGKLYQLPLTFGVTGILAERSALEDGQVGFTLDQYKQFVSTSCNGVDPMELNPNDFFAICINALNDEYIKDGTANYNNADVKALAEFTKQNVPELTAEQERQKLPSTELPESEVFDGGEYEKDASFSTLINTNYAKMSELTLVGIPSINGNGPMLTVNSSVAVSAKSQNKDACIEFIKSLLSEDIQNEYCRGGVGTSLRISSFEEMARFEIDKLNKSIRVNQKVQKTWGFDMGNAPLVEIDYSTITDFEEVIDSVSKVSTTDPSIIMILKEEMAPYFKDQKSIDDVLSVVENRVQTFLNERG